MTLPPADSCVLWSYLEPGENDEVVTVVMSEADIIATCYSWWQAQMRSVGKAHLISERACIEDWVVVHWAGRAYPMDSPASRLNATSRSSE